VSRQRLARSAYHCAHSVTAHVIQSASSVRCPLCEGELGPVILRSNDRIYELDGEFGVRECHTCGLGVTDPRLEGAALARHYPSEYPPWQARERSLLPRVKRARARATSQLPPYGTFVRRARGAVLDVGCGRGDRAAAFSAAGWRVRAVDPSPDAIAAVRVLGIEAEVGTIETAPWADSSFDLIIMSHSLEHMPDPAGAVRRARELLRPGGFLIVSVPNWESWQRKIFAGRWAMVDVPRHLQHFTTDTLHHLARRAGFARGRTRQSISAYGLAVTLQYASFGRWKLRGTVREVFLATAIVTSPLFWLLTRPLGGDTLYLVAQA
jgi:SAM-dependent methyltransferase